MSCSLRIFHREISVSSSTYIKNIAAIKLQLIGCLWYPLTLNLLIAYIYRDIPLKRAGQNCRFHEIKQPISIMRQNRRLYKRHQTSDFVNETKPRFATKEPRKRQN